MLAPSSRRNDSRVTTKTDSSRVYAGEQHARLPRRLGLLNAISINMSNMVGTGPFITVPAILATLGGPQSLIAKSAPTAQAGPSSFCANVLGATVGAT